MKLVSYWNRDGEDWGVVLDDARIAPGRSLLDSHYKTLQHVLSDARLDGLQVAAEKCPDRLDLDKVDLLPVIPRPTHFFSAGLNYAAHIDESDNEAPESPRFHMRAFTSLAGHRTPVVRPRVSEVFDYEGELAVIIGKAGRHIREQDAFQHIAGYTCFMDGSIRDYQKHSVTSGKNFYRTGGLGPWLVTADTLPFPPKLDLVTRHNGIEVQNANTAMMIYSIAAMISYLSRITVLHPGDIIATGTPKGIGHKRNPPILLQPGDTIEVEIGDIGLLSNSVIKEAPDELQPSTRPL